MSEEDLSLKQQQILDFIRSQVAAKGYPPSVRDICTAVGLSSTSSVHAHLSTLEKRGYIRRDPSKPRAIELISSDVPDVLPSSELVQVPVVGRVAAGEPILAQQNIESYMPFPVSMLPNKETFILNVHGDSMINMGIYDGDQIIVQRESTAHNGEVVVALIDDSATVKRFYKEKDFYRLQPENDYMDPIITDHVKILGKVIGLLRMNIH